MLDVLRPLFRGELASYGETLQLSTSREARLSVAQWLADPAHLEGALERHAEFLHGARARKAVASDWTLRYLTALLPPLVALASLLKYRLAAGWREMAMTTDALGAPAVFEIEQVGTACPEADAAARYEALVWQHLEPLMTHLVQRTKVPAKVLRGNARRVLLGVFDYALGFVGADPVLRAALIEDRRQLLELPIWPDGRPNPLFMRHRRARSETLHASCCLAYLLPQTPYCAACPLDRRHTPARASHLHE